MRDTVYFTLPHGAEYRINISGRCSGSGQEMGESSYLISPYSILILANFIFDINKF